MQASKTFYKKCCENSRSQIVFRTDIFGKLTLGVPEQKNVLVMGGGGGGGDLSLESITCALKSKLDCLLPSFFGRFFTITAIFGSFITDLHLYSSLMDKIYFSECTASA